jgi:energy-coupling factor transporter ATP-binding protein EcfA2
VILATHDRDTIQRVGRRVLTLDRGRLILDQELVGTDPPVLDPLVGTTEASIPDFEPSDVPESPASEAPPEESPE